MGLLRLARRHLLVLPTAVLTVVFFVVPLALIASTRSAQIDPVSLDVFFGWTTANYRAFDSTLYLHSLLRSILLSLGATADLRRARVLARVLHLAPAATCADGCCSSP